jgi:hypothetical protein
VSEAVRAFLADHVDGFQELELLAALVARGGSASIEDLARDAHTTVSELVPAVERLRGSGVLDAGEPRDACRVAVDDPRLEELVEIYRRDPVVVLRMLNSLAIERVRLGATRAFADAFLIRRKNRDD